MRIFILLILLISYPANAEIVKAVGTHKHLGSYSQIESCGIALEKAKKKAIMNSLGETVSSEIVSNCSEVDGELYCERNQFSLLSLKGDIVDIDPSKPEYSYDSTTGISMCKQSIVANVLPIKQNTDPNFQFDVNMNEKTFKSGDVMEIEVNTSKEMYISIFQWLPYGGKKYNKITKIFPNEDFNANTNNLVSSNLKLKYGTYFPDEINKKMVDEYLVFVASEKEIPWLNEYTKIDGLKKQLVKSKVLIEKHYMGYVIIK